MKYIDTARERERLSILSSNCSRIFFGLTNYAARVFIANERKSRRLITYRECFVSHGDVLLEAGVIHGGDGSRDLRWTATEPTKSVSVERESDVGSGGE